MSEHDEQAALFSWVAWNCHAMPDLMLLFAIPNGASVKHQVGKNGKAFSLEGMKLKAEGLRQGVPDLFLPVARMGKHGLFIEMKTATGRVSPAQKAWHDRLRAQGYFVSVCRGWAEAREEITIYLGMREDVKTI